MIVTLAAVAIATTVGFSPHTDTTLSVPADAKIVIENFAGDVVVSTWSKNALRIEAEHSSRARVEVERDGSTVSIKPRGRWGAPTSVDFRITAPAAASFEISGVNTDVTVSGTRGEVSVETVRGDVNVTGGTGHLVLSSVEGDVVLERARGRAELRSVNSGVTVNGLEGELAAETVNGEITLEEISGLTVEASTVNGDVIYQGEVKSGGHYSFTTHNGDITVALPASPSVAVSVYTYNGDFDSSFPVKVTSTHRNRRMRFTLGGGAAELELESFQGAIRLEKREGAELARTREKLKDHKKDAKHDPDPNPNPDQE